MATTTIGVQSRSHGGGGGSCGHSANGFSLQIDCRVFYQVKNVISPKFYDFTKGVLVVCRELPAAVTALE
jgi:hypothetical protein